MNKKTIAAAIGASFVTTLSATVVNAESNPFALKELASGYAKVAEAAADQAKKPEAKCGAEVMKGNPEMKCGASMMNMGNSAAPAAKAVEKKCAGMKMDDKNSTAPANPPATPAK